MSRLHLHAYLPATFAKVTPVAVCALVLGLGSVASAAPLPVSGCMDEFNLVMEVLETPVAGMSVGHDRGEDMVDTLPIEDGFDYGMSCDGPLSCSPQLVYALEQLERRRNTGEQGPMCIPGDPDCNVSPGMPVHQPNLELGHTVVPFVSEPHCRAKARAPKETTSRPHGAQHLVSRDLVWRVDRPPRHR